MIKRLIRRLFEKEPQKPEFCSAKQTGFKNSNYCVCCGEEIPEGLLVCPLCAIKASK